MNDKVPPFYCRKYSGDPDFSISEWNDEYMRLVSIDASEELMREILHPELSPCTNQCFTCLADVGERRLKTKQIKDTSAGKPAKQT